MKTINKQNQPASVIVLIFLFSVSLTYPVIFDFGFGFCTSRSLLSRILRSGGLKYTPNDVICLMGLLGYMEKRGTKADSILLSACVL